MLTKILGLFRRNAEAPEGVVDINGHQWDKRPPRLGPRIPIKPENVRPRLKAGHPGMMLNPEEYMEFPERRQTNAPASSLTKPEVSLEEMSPAVLMDVNPEYATTLVKSVIALQRLDVKAASIELHNLLVAAYNRRLRAEMYKLVNETPLEQR